MAAKQEDAREDNKQKDKESELEASADKLRRTIRHSDCLDGVWKITGICIRESAEGEKKSRDALITSLTFEVDENFTPEP